MDTRMATLKGLQRECNTFINSYLLIYDSYYSNEQKRDDAFLKDLADAFIVISAVLEVYSRDGEINSEYALEKLEYSKSIINSVINFYERKEK